MRSNRDMPNDRGLGRKQEVETAVRSFKHANHNGAQGNRNRNMLRGESRIMGGPRLRDAYIPRTIYMGKRCPPKGAHMRREIAGGGNK